ncbi:sensor histidine kinase N-terminal domain-containing protein [Variovorax dokdonensis]|uniref:histidine kinase n=1 Tax=Variovorax dokdonensis TaxID=344883 RepID=A0ABT7N9J7_9BURK|nr:sensor histidine kinase N-terminal domain-containing protein [Variovorax dokdonensis]MDM0044601.1 sensor histidine kinase N-terminal domain-containing protein [Variovorax dokdonensis]
MRLFQHGQRSLFGEILDWMLTPLLLLVPVSIGMTWLVAQGIANRPFDRTLQFNAQTLARLVSYQDGLMQFRLPQAASEFLRADDTDHVYYQVLGADGQLLGGDADLPKALDEADNPGDVVLRDDTMRGQTVRVAATWVTFNGVDGAPLRVQIQVAETREKQRVLAAEIIKGVLLPQFAILPLAILLIWLALVRGIKPLSELEDRIRERRPDDLSPLDDSQVPVEVAPLVMSVNGLLTKLKETLATQKRFLADAAHQLKTPLAGLRMQADLALRDGANEDELKQSLKHIGRSSIRATHTVNQLLSLARAEGGIGALAPMPCDLARLAIEVVREAVPRALDRRIDLGYDGVQPGVPGAQLQGHPTLLKELVRNLLDNAIAYTPSSADQPGVITVRVLADPFGKVLLLQVEDNGAGIAGPDRELIFEPFYRVLGNEADGSGLGLPIVREIAARHDAQVSLEDAHPGRQPPGARFTVRFELERSR